MKLIKRYLWVPISLIVVGLIAWMMILRLQGHPWADWTGFGDYTGPLTKDQRGKTLWDSMQLLIIPAVLGVGALLFNWSEKKNDRKIAEDRNKNEQKISADRMREAALQTYIDRMTELLLDKGLRTSDGDAEVRDVARTRTLTTLRMLDPIRKGDLIRFLKEAEVITKDEPIIKLRGAHLRNADLCNANLSGADLTRANLSLADLSDADLSEANLSKAYLRRTNLSRANLSRANLREAKMEHTILDDAKLTGTIMPDGTVHE